MIKKTFLMRTWVKSTLMFQRPIVGERGDWNHILVDGWPGL